MFYNSKMHRTHTNIHLCRWMKEEINIIFYLLYNLVLHFTEKYLCVTGYYSTPLALVTVDLVWMSCLYICKAM